MDMRPWFKAVTDLAVFLEISEEPAVDDDAAIAQLEQLAATLGQLDTEARQPYLDYLAERVARTAPGPERDFLATLPEDLGLA